jgi:ABC-type nitrate/sulfonate/bicarbonate transport system substrate-binding protein
LTVEDVEIVDQKETLAALQFKEDRSFSAVVGWNPIINKALSDNSYIAATSADFPKVIYDVMVAKKSFVDENPGLVDSFVSDFYKSIQDDDIIDKTAQSLSVTSKEYKSWLQDAYVFRSRVDANDQYKRLIHQSKKIVNFLTTAPKSIQGTEAKSRFRPRKLDINSLIHFKTKQ